VNVTDSVVPKAWPERLQHGLQQALGHDLPNHLVAIQGMLRLVELEQSANLGAEGQAYLKRLTAATTRTQSLVRTLHLFALAGRHHETRETVSLADAARGAAAEVQALFPDRFVQFAFDLRAPSVQAPARSFRLILVQLLGQALQNLPQGKYLLEIGSTDAGTEVFIWVAEKGEPNGLEVPARLKAIAGRASGQTDHLLSLYLVREIVTAWDAQLRVDLEPGRPLLLGLVFRAKREG
jgi:signal transduction histidine kinase